MKQKQSNHECVCIWIIKDPEYRDRISIRMKQKQPNHECVCIRIIEFKSLKKNCVAEFLILIWYSQVKQKAKNLESA